MSIKGFGTDIVEISRIKAQVDKHFDRLAKYVLTEAELIQFYNCKFPERFLAKRFAAKEAAAKALGTGISQGVTFNDFGITNDHLGRPLLDLFGMAKNIAVKMDITFYHISISDEKKYAIATVIYE